MLTCAHNTPFGDINDSEDDLQPLVFTMFQDALRSLRLLAGALRSATVDRAHLASRATKDFLTVTELADTLVRSEGLSFREAHGLVAAAVWECGEDDSAANIARTIRRIRPGLKLSNEAIEKALDPGHFVRIRTIIGGPAPERTLEAVQRARAGAAFDGRLVARETRTAEQLTREAHSSIIESVCGGTSFTFYQLRCYSLDLMRTVDLIHRKRDREELSPEEIAYLVDGYTNVDYSRLSDGLLPHGRVLFPYERPGG